MLKRRLYALSTRLIREIKRGNDTYQQRYQCGDKATRRVVSVDAISQQCRVFDKDQLNTPCICKHPINLNRSINANTATNTMTGTILTP